MINILIYLYLILLPVSDLLFDYIFYFNIAGRYINVVDIFNIVIFVIILINSRNRNKKDKNNILLGIGFILIMIYPKILSYILYNEPIFNIIISLVKSITKYLPLIMLINIKPPLISSKGLIISLCICSFIFMILSYYNEYIVLDVLKTNYPIVEQYGPLSSNRAMGFINLGDGNSQTIFCAYILSIVLYAFFNGYINSTIVIISFMSCFINIAFIASRGGLLTGILVILLNIGKHITFNKKTVFEISILISAIILFVYFNYQKLYYVSYRMLKSGVTQNDLDPKAKSGRLVSAIEGIDYIVENPNILLNGDTKAKFNLYGQTVHNGFVKSIHYAGILGIVWVLYMLIYAQKKIGKGRLSIIIPFIISLLTLPDFYFLYYLFYAIYYIDIIKYEKYERNK